MEINFLTKKGKFLLSIKVKEFVLFLLMTANIALFSSKKFVQLLFNCLYSVVLFLIWNSSLKIIHIDKWIFLWKKLYHNFFLNISLKLGVALLNAFGTDWYFSSHLVWTDNVLFINCSIKHVSCGFISKYCWCKWKFLLSFYMRLFIFLINNINQN